jgi:hypothetical protein
MNNFYNNQNRQKYGNNVLVNEYNNYNKQNLPFNKNYMLSNNPIFIGSIKDPAFAERLQTAKLEQLKRAKNISELNISEKELINYVICPIEPVKLERNKAIELYQERDLQYEKFKINKQNNKKIIEYSAELVTPSKLIKEWENNRTNLPYKNILKNENYKKSFTTKEDLLIYKITALDKDQIALKKEYKKIKNFIKKHNDQLSLIYSKSDENKYKEEFKYIQKYKYRIKYDPSDLTGVKKYYKNEQVKITKNEKRVDDMIESLLQNEEFSEEDLQEIHNNIKNINKIKDDNNINNINNNNSIEDFINENKKELKKEFGDDYEKYITEIKNQFKDDDLSDEENSSNDITENKIKNKISVKISSKKNSETIDNIEKKKIIVKTKIIETSSKKNYSEPIIGVIEDDLINKYKNRK